MLNNPPFPKVYQQSVPSDGSFGHTELITFAPYVCTSLQIHNRGSGSVEVQLNGDPGAVFQLDEGDIQSFPNDCLLTSIDFMVTMSGSGGVLCEVIAFLQNP